MKSTKTKIPVEIVFHPSWWYKHTGITFDEDFFYHPLKRVESERLMERELYERFGEFGLGDKRNDDLPVIGAVHNAAGYIISEMLGCEIRYAKDEAPQVICAKRNDFAVDVDGAMNAPPIKRLNKLVGELKNRYGYLCGDINWGGVLNVALDLRGDEMLTDMMLRQDETAKYFNDIAAVIEKFIKYVQALTGTTSISVNRIVKHINPEIFLHSECTHTMISEDLYEQFLLPIDLKWSQTLRPFGIHYCGRDPHRYADSFAKIPNLAFLDLGWGGDVRILREKLPNTFFSIRLDPVTINDMPNEKLEESIRQLVSDSANPMLTGVCCINMDANTDDSKIKTIYRTVEACSINNS